MAEQHKKKTGSRGIEWSSLTVGPFGGCMHDCRWSMPDGTIAGCYAKSLAETGVAKSAYPHGFEHHYFRPNAIKQLTSKKTPQLIFVDSMADMFAHNVPADQLIQVFNAMRTAPQHVYQSLTKAAPQILKYLPHLPPNLWVGVSSPPDFMFGQRFTDGQQAAMLQRSIEVLRETKEKTGNIVWMSAEPISWDLTTVLDENHPLDWIVIGAASNGPQYFQPAAHDVEKLLRLMDRTNTPVFFKGNIEETFDTNDFGSSALNRWREDFPTHYRDGTLIQAVQKRQEDCDRYGWPKIGGDRVKSGSVNQRELFGVDDDGE